MEPIVNTAKCFSFPPPSGKFPPEHHSHVHFPNWSKWLFSKSHHRFIGIFPQSLTIRNVICHEQIIFGWTKSNRIDAWGWFGNGQWSNRSIVQMHVTASTAAYETWCGSISSIDPATNNRCFLPIPTIKSWSAFYRIHRQFRLNHGIHGKLHFWMHSTAKKSLVKKFGAMRDRK